MLRQGQIIWTEEVVSAGRHMGEGGWALENCPDL